MKSIRTTFGAVQRVLAAAAVLGGFAVATFTGAAPAQAAGEKVLNHTYEMQQNGYYCGPASVRIALSTLGVSRSQDEIANYMGTTSDGTASAANITRAMNHFANTSYYETKWIPGQSATQAQINLLKADVVFDIDRAHGFVVNVVGTGTDVDGDSHTYNGGHYIAVIGYRNGGADTRIADPADRYHYYWIDTTRLAHWIAARGYSA